MLIQNAQLLLPAGGFERCDIRFQASIEAIGSFPEEPGMDASGCYLLPGLIDLHTHGAMGCDFSSDTADVSAAARFYAAHGVTGFLAATMTLPEPDLIRAAAHIAAFSPGADMAACLGIHMEGPFLSYEKRGAQRADCLRAPDTALFRRVQSASGGRVRLVTVAPETPGAMEFIRLASKNCRVSLGHSAADYDTAAAALHAGAGQLTHLYNGMNELCHRQPGLIGAGMDQGAFAELICDGVHVHPAAVRAAFKLFDGRIQLISDSLACTGLCDGVYTLGGQSVMLRDGRCTQNGADTLAGSVITVYEGLKNAVRFGVPLESAAAAATHHPARALHAENERGFLKPGLRADLLLLDAALHIRAVYIGGRRVAAAGT